MLANRIIPCLDVRDGRVVKGIKFSGLRDAGDPAERAALYEEQGADEIVLLDISATTEKRKTQVRTVKAVRKVLSIPLTVGGGVSTADDAQALLEAGADKVSVNTAAVENPALVSDIAERFGSQCAILALDASAAKHTPVPSGFEVLVRSGKERTGIDAVAWARQAVSIGAGEILLTSFDRDGTREGYDLPLLRAVSSAVSVPVIASGGASTVKHLHEAIEAGAQAVLAASIFHYGEISVGDIKKELSDLGLRMRL